MCKKINSFALKNFEKFKKEHPDMVGKGSCSDCAHLINDDWCSGPPLDRDDVCSPGYEQFKPQREIQIPNIGNFKIEKYDPNSGKSLEEWLMED